ncbi:HEAT repeat domain-containing protein [Candidatus Micrarchaeota archaeon]|nr:HEAT repeat domain-containing protein [Candidatus Micrarchaeota archaeon]
MSNGKIELLLENLQSRNSSSRSSAAYLLGQRASEIAGPQRDSAVSLLIGAFGDEPSMLRANAAETLGKLKATSAISALTGILDDADEAVMKKAAEALCIMKAREAAPKLLEIVLSSKAVLKMHRGHAAAVALRGIREPSCAPNLVLALRSQNAQVRAHAAIALGGTNVPGVNEALISALKDLDWMVRFNSACSLGELKNGKSLRPLIRTLNTDEDGIVKSGAARSLGKLKKPSAVPHLLSCIRKGDERLIREAAQALSEIRPRGIDDLRLLANAIREIKKRTIQEPVLREGLGCLWETYSKWAARLSRMRSRGNSGIRPPPRFRSCPAKFARKPPRQGKIKMEAGQ